MSGAFWSRVQKKLNTSTVHREPNPAAAPSYGGSSSSHRMSGRRANTACRSSCMQCLAVRWSSSLPRPPAAYCTTWKHALTTAQTEASDSSGAARDRSSAASTCSMRRSTASSAAGSPLRSTRRPATASSTAWTASRAPGEHSSNTSARRTFSTDDSATPTAAGTPPAARRRGRA
jgi:hypothetical protein